MSEPITNVEDAVREMGALPVPVGSERMPVQGQRPTMLDHARIALNARMTKDNLRLVLENVITYAASLETRIAELEAERHSTNEALVDVTEALRGAQQPPKKQDPRGCSACGSLPETWCPDCAACEQGCFGGFDGNSCTHANAKWGGAR